MILKDFYSHNYTFIESLHSLNFHAGTLLNKLTNLLLLSSSNVRIL